jgi:hypothetical protein
LTLVEGKFSGPFFTPISPRSLSGQPLILLEHHTLRVQMQFNGKARQPFQAGDHALVCDISFWPVPTPWKLDSTRYFL